MFGCNGNQPISHFFQHQVAGFMSVKIIDLLEIIEIEIDQGDIFSGLQFLFDYIAYARAISQPRGIILDGDNADFALRIVRDLRLPGENLRATPN